MLKTLSKASLQRISLARNVNPIGTKEQLLDRIVIGRGPFGIDLNAQQEEQVLSLVGVSNFALEEYVSREIPNREEILEDLLDEEVGLSPREELITLILNEPLSDTSKLVLEYVNKPLKVLQKLAGNYVLPRTRLIRLILNIEPTFPEVITHLRRHLYALGFQLVSQPEPVALLPRTSKPITINGVKKLINRGEDPSDISITLLSAVADDYVIKSRKLGKHEVIKLLVDSIIYPLLPMWEVIRNYLRGLRHEELDLLINSLGYGTLTPMEKDFLMSHGFLIGYKSRTLDLTEVTERFYNLLIDRYGEDPEDTIETLSENEKKWIRKLIELDQYEGEELIEMALVQGISIDNEDEFWQEAFLYLSVEHERISFSQRPGLNLEELKLYSDLSLLAFCPYGPYGRENLLAFFIDYWKDDRIFVYRDNYYFGNWEKHVKARVDLTTLAWEELVDLLGWVTDKRPILNEMKDIIQNTEYKTIPRLEDVSQELINVFRQLFAVGVFAVGGNETFVPHVISPTDDEKLDGALDDLTFKLEEIEDNVLELFPMIDLRRMKTLDIKLLGIKTELPNYTWLETATFYLMLYDPEVSISVNPILRI